MLELNHWQILKLAAQEGVINFEDFASIRGYDKKLTYEVLEELNLRNILIDTDKLGTYLINYEKLFSLMKEVSQQFQSADMTYLRRNIKNVSLEIKNLLIAIMETDFVKLSDMNISKNDRELQFLVRKEILTLCGDIVFSVIHKESLNAIFIER